MPQPSPNRPAAAGAAAAALSPQDRANAERIASRLRSELRRVLASLPAEARGASGLARLLGIERTTCQRLVSALDRAKGLDLFERLPGVRGLRAVLEALRGRGAADEDLEAAEAAVDEFEQLLRGLGAGRSALVQSLFAPAQEPAGAGPPTRWSRSVAELRERHFDTSAEIAGRWSDVQVALWVIGPEPADPTRMLSLKAGVFVQHQSRLPAMPLVISSFVRVADPSQVPDGTDFCRSLDAQPIAGKSPSALLRSFSSDPLPRITSRQDSLNVEHYVDFEAEPRGRPFDLAIAHRAAQAGIPPYEEDPPLQEIWHLTAYPARHLVFDTFLHEDLVRRSIPSLSTHAWNPGLVIEVDRWTTHIPGAPRLQLLGPGIEAAACDAYPRQPELLQSLLASTGWDPKRFHGFRCETPFPLWRIGYCMRFDFR